MSPIWSSTSDWDAAQSETGVHHEQPTGTDWAASDVVEKGYPTDWSNWSIPTPTTYIPFDEDSGTTAADQIGSNDATLNGSTLGATGILGTSAVDHDGTDDTTTIRNRWNYPVTVAFWLNFQQSSGVYFITGFDYGSDLGWLLKYDSVNEVHIFSGNLRVVNDFTPATGWQLWTVTVDSAGTWTVYFDGTQELSGVDKNDGVNSNVDTYLASENDAQNYAEATISDLLIWGNTELTSAQVSELYEAAV